MQGVTETQPKGQLAEVSQKPITRQRLTIASMSDYVRENKRLHIVAGISEERSGSALKRAKARCMRLAQVPLRVVGGDRVATTHVE